MTVQARSPILNMRFSLLFGGKRQRGIDIMSLPVLKNRGHLERSKSAVHCNDELHSIKDVLQKIYKCRDL